VKYNFKSFNAEFPDDAACLEYIFKSRFPEQKCECGKASRSSLKNRDLFVSMKSYYEKFRSTFTGREGILTYPFGPRHPLGLIEARMHKDKVCIYPGCKEVLRTCPRHEGLS
jgi:hypothetical protein